MNSNPALDPIGCLMFAFFRFIRKKDKPKDQWDLALIRVSAKEKGIPEPTKTPYKHNSICLTGQDMLALESGRIPLEIGGWGEHEKGNPADKRRLQKAQITYDAGKNACLKSGGSQAPGKPAPPYYCVSSKGQPQICCGDSGGPLMWRSPTNDTVYALGVVAWGSGPEKACGKSTLDGYYDFYSDIEWMNQIMSKNWP